MFDKCEGFISKLKIQYRDLTAPNNLWGDKDLKRAFPIFVKQQIDFMYFSKTESNIIYFLVYFLPRKLNECSV